jgi:hypothetical protein
MAHDFVVQNYQMVTTWVSLIVAVIALVFTIYQAILSRKHNRLSVRPSMTIWTHSEKNDHQGSLKVDLLNTGLGPAVIKKCVILYDGKPVTGDLHDFAESQLKAIGPHIKLLAGAPREYAMPANENRTLIEIIFPMENAQTSELYKNFLNRFDLICEYQSVYGEKMEFDSQSESLRLK